MFGASRSWPKLNREDIIKRSRLLVIDDSEFYYLDLFKGDGYTIEKWDNVVDLQKLESDSFDVVLLDIQGVGKDYSSEQGLGILRHVKRVNPTQLVVAYSNADWGLKYQEFFKLADATLPKTEDYVVFKEEVDRLLKTRFSPEYYIQKASGCISDSVGEAARLQRIVRSAILRGNSHRLSRVLEKSSQYAQIAGVVLQIVQVAIAMRSAAALA